MGYLSLEDLDNYIFRTLGYHYKAALAHNNNSFLQQRFQSNGENTRRKS